MGDYYSVATAFQTTLYADPDTTIQVELGFDAATGTIASKSIGICGAILQGYAVTLERPRD